MYFTTAGLYPFQGHDDFELARAVLQSDYRCPIEDIDCSAAAKQLMCCLMAPANRSSKAAAALQHVFFEVGRAMSNYRCPIEDIDCSAAAKRLTRYLMARASRHSKTAKQRPRYNMRSSRLEA